MTQETVEISPGVLMRRHKGWRVMWKNDGLDYPKLLEDFLAGKIEAEEYKKDYSTSVHQADVAGRRYIFKHYYKLEPRAEKRLLHLLLGTFYSRIFRLTQKAVGRGCQCVQDMYLVAEQFQGPYAKEVWLIAEYVEGIPLASAHPGPKLLERREDVFRVTAEMHKSGLASNDLHAQNMIVTPRGDIKIIDISINSPLLISQIKDLVRLSHKFGSEPPFKEILLPTWGKKFMYSLVFMREKMRRGLRRLQGKDKGGRKIAPKGGQG